MTWFLFAVIATLVIIVGALIGQHKHSRRLLAKNRELEQAIAERTQDLQHQQTLKDRFFANAAHEFSTPLTLTIGPLETLLSEYADDLGKQQQQLASTALNNAKKMQALVGQVLDINRLAAGKLPLFVSCYDICELMHSCKDRFTPWAEQNGQTLACQPGVESLWLHFDHEQIEKCIANLISNAIKYSGDGSSISMSLTSQPDKVGICVSDNGVGISPEAQQKVFERYYQERRSERLTAPGTGIGLALVSEIIDLHHGEVTLESRPGHGCEFTLWLKLGSDHFNADELQEPVLRERAPDLAPGVIAPLPDAPDTKDSTILVVDENPELRNFISLRLATSYRVIEAENGLLGFTRACESQPDLIISDVMMPQMTGLELTEKLKGTPATQHIPIILLTAKSSKRDTVEGLALGADDYITKPFDPAELLMRVHTILESQKRIRRKAEFDVTSEQLQVETRSPFIEQLNSHILANLGKNDFSIEQLAKLMNMSRETLARQCKKEIKQSPLAYLRHIRMVRATNLLRENTMSISEVAYALGFENLAYFSRSFKAHTGVSPSEFIKGNIAQ